MREKFPSSERRACGVLGVRRSLVRYRRRRPDDAPLRARLRELAAERPRFGYRGLHVLLRREGFRVNHKRVYRLYREEGLLVRPVKRKRLRAVARALLVLPTTANEVWTMDFTQDALASGRRVMPSR